MKKKIALSFIACMVFSGLAGCAMTGENYYTIDVYSDYIGMEEDLAAHGRYTVDVNSSYAATTLGLKKVGYCYAVKGKDAKIGGLSLVDSKFTGKSSTRTPEKGHKYVFDKFKGFYSNGTAIDLGAIQSNCYVFATFTDELEDYVITVRNAFDEAMFSQRMTFRENASETAEDPEKGELAALLKQALPHDPIADPDDFSTWRDPHYYRYDFKYWRFSVEGKKESAEYPWEYDKDKDRSYISLDSDKALLYRFEEATRVTPFYEKSYQIYDVEIDYQIRTFDEATQTFKYSSPVTAAPQKVTYAHPVDYAALGLDGYTCVGEGLNGGDPTRYGDNMNIPAGQLKKKLPTELVELYAGGYRGTVVDRNDIAFGCKVNLIFTKDVAKYTLRFHNDYNDASAYKELVVEEGQTFDAPAMKGIAPAGKSFADWAVKNELDELVAVNVADIHESCDLYPLMVDTVVYGDNGKLKFQFDSDLYGYSLVQVDKDATEIAPADFVCAAMPKNYPLYGVDSFKGATGETYAKLTSVIFPEDSTLWWFAHGLFTDLRLSEATVIDLSTTQAYELHSYAFHNLPRVAEIDLPDSLGIVGSALFTNCTSLTKVKIDLTEDEVKARIDNGQFAADWAGGFSGTITYKIAE